MYVISSDSDSDDYCYDKFPEKLQKLKNRLAFKLSKVVDTSIEDIHVESNGINLNSRRDSDVVEVFDIDQSLPKENIDDLENSSNRVCTRSNSRKRRKSNIQLSTAEATQRVGKRGRGRGRGRSRGNKTSAPNPRSTDRRRGEAAQNVAESYSMTLTVVTPPPRRRGRSSRQHSRQISQNSQSIVTYSIGNTDDYPDFSDNLQLFSNKDNNTGEPSRNVIDLDESINNEELSVKVYWQHSEVFKFNIRRHQKMNQIFDFFINKEGVSKEHLLFTYNFNKTNKILCPNDTPDSINYNIAKFIEGGIVNKEFCLNTTNTPQKKGFLLKFQCQNKKKPFELSVSKNDKLQIAMVKCAERMEIPIAKLIFEFDGEILQGNATPKDLDMESGDCIDVKQCIDK